MAGGADGVAAVAKHGGTPSGKIGTGGTVPGTPEHAQAKRDAEAKRKRDYRAGLRAKNPPALPVSLPPALPGASYTPSPVADLQSPGVGAPVVPWDVEPLREIAAEVIALGEQAYVAKETTKGVKAKLPKVILQEIEKKSRFNPAAKVTLAKTAPVEICKAMESAGISGKWQNLLLLFGAGAIIGLGMKKNSADTDRLVVESGTPTEEKK